MKSDEEKLLRILRDCLTRLGVELIQDIAEINGDYCGTCDHADCIQFNFVILARELVDAGVTVKS